LPLASFIARKTTKTCAVPAPFLDFLTGQH